MTWHSTPLTYMRTDSVDLSEDYCAAAREWLQAKDPANVPEKVSKQKSKKGAQEAHEAIRPTDISKPSASLRGELPDKEFQLYVLIWKRALASQCRPALIRKTRVLIQSGEVQWQAKGQVVEFKGYSKYWQDISADRQLPVLQENQQLQLANAGHEQKQTQPPPRYTEPKLVQLMEKKGIGRPSTYAPTIKTIKLRNYLEVVKKRLKPTQMGMEVDVFMQGALPELLQAEFTAEMESQLDEIANGKQNWEQYLIGWNTSYFAPAIEKASSALPAASPGNGPQRTLEKSRIKCPKCDHCMVKVPWKKSPKGYFLKCDRGCKNGDRDLVLFWGQSSKQWELPGAKPKRDRKPAVLTDYPCPVCKAKLEEHFYERDGEEKSMLRCSDPRARQKKNHKQAVYFRSRGAWWSPKYGTIESTPVK